MTRLRFPVSVLALGLAAGALALPAFGQDARIEDIQISQAADANGSISILVKLSGQPKSASAVQTGGVLAVDLDGVTLPLLAFDPAGNALVRHVAVTPPLGEATSSHIRFEGAAFSGATTTIYRNAVLIEARLAEASLPASASLMAAATPAKATPPAKPATPVEPRPAPAKPAEIKTADAKPPLVQPIAPVAAKVAEPKPADVKPAAAKSNVLESHAPVQLASQLASTSRPTPPVSPSAPVAPTRAVVSMTHVAKLDADACAGAEAQLATDAWSLPALGNRALCLIDQQRFPEAKNRIDQLAAFSPEDWRVNLGRAALADHDGDASKAEIGYRNAAQLAPDSDIRNAIKDLLTKQISPAQISPAIN